MPSDAGSTPAVSILKQSVTTAINDFHEDLLISLRLEGLCFCLRVNHKERKVKRMGKYQLDKRSKVAAAKYQDGKKPTVSNKKERLNQLREAYLQKQQEKK